MSLREHPEVLAFKAAAEEFCALLENEPIDSNRWVKDILAAVAMLYARAHFLPL